MKVKQKRILEIFGYILETKNEIWRVFTKFFRDLLTWNLKTNNIFSRFENNSQQAKKCSQKINAWTPQQSSWKRTKEMNMPEKNVTASVLRRRIWASFPWKLRTIFPSPPAAASCDLSCNYSTSRRLGGGNKRYQKHCLSKQARTYILHSTPGPHLGTFTIFEWDLFVAILSPKNCWIWTHTPWFGLSRPYL
jgi:hypothetical protein